MEENKVDSCGCGHDHDHDNCDCEELETMELELEDGSTMVCNVIGIFDVEGYEDKEFIALLQPDDDVIFYEYSEDEEANPILDSIESDDVYNKVCDVFMELIEGEDEDEE
jgi:uncharacterized protein YrzB (UPF0473 family)